MDEFMIPETVLQEKSVCGIPLQDCPKCNAQMSALPGTRDAVCKNCGFKDPCCE